MLSGRCSDTCCSTSQICLNRGKCQANCLESGKRFKCACPDGFTGNRCEIKPRSCASYVYSSNRTDGLRLIYDPNNTTYLVFCHFYVSSSTLVADTLVMSFERSCFDALQKEPLTKDFPREQKNPNWEKYKLSLERMKALRDESTDWAFTCKYNTRGFSHDDFLRVKFAKCDILTYKGASDGNCIDVEYVNIRGSSCSNCKFSVSQGGTTFHVGKTHNNCGAWVDYTSKTCGITKARYFGSYTCTDTSFACMATSSSTNQLWFRHYFPT